MKNLLLACATSVLLTGCASLTDAQKLSAACDTFQAASIGLELYQAEKGSLDSTPLGVVAGVHAVIDPICSGTQPLPTDVGSTLVLVEQSGLRLLALKPVVVSPQ